jgi:UDP-glucose 4-epimerase
MLKNKHIFITGGAGFIGSTLAGLLLEDNKVTVFDTFQRDSLSGRPFAKHPNLRTIRGDILDAPAVREAMAGATHVVHCAAIAGIDTVTKSPCTTLRVNMIGSANVLEAAQAVGGLERVVCFSTSEIFGARAFRVDEASPAIVGAVGEPRWTYAVGKLAEEHLAIAYHAEFGLPTTVVRPFNVYGPGQVGEGAIRNFMIAALSGAPITIHGDGAQIRAWCYVDDMIDCVLRALERPEAVGETFNVGHPASASSIYALAEAIVRVTGSKSQITRVERAGADVELRVPDVAKARKLLGFEAQVGLEEGIRRTANWFAEAK